MMLLSPSYYSGSVITASGLHEIDEVVLLDYYLQEVTLIPFTKRIDDYWNRERGTAWTNEGVFELYEHTLFSDKPEIFGVKFNVFITNGQSFGLSEFYISSYYRTFYEDTDHPLFYP
jgi:hypothetical protein